MKKLFVVTVFCLIAATTPAQSTHHDFLKAHAPEAEGKSYKVHATVIKIYHEEKKITLKHGAIKGYMPAMTMTFPVKNASLLENLHEGGTGIFTIFIFKGLPSVTGVKITNSRKKGVPRKS